MQNPGCSPAQEFDFVATFLKPFLGRGVSNSMPWGFLHSGIAFRGRTPMFSVLSGESKEVLKSNIEAKNREKIDRAIVPLQENSSTGIWVSRGVLIRYADGVVLPCMVFPG
jgi:hypothetical protein